jgi:tRNA-dihydrouridine synthase B
MRAGRWKGETSAVDAARRCEAAGAAAVCLHPRFSEGAAVTPPDWALIAEVKRAVKIPVIGNGGIHLPADVLRMFKDTGCDAVAIGQAAVGRPWIFRQAAALMAAGEVPPPPPAGEIRAILLEHYQGLVALHGERRGTMMMRKQSCHYAKALPNGKKFNMAVQRLSTEADYLAAVEEHLSGPAQG